MLCTACAVSSIYFPQYHREFGPAALKTTYTVYYWYADTSLVIGGEPVVMRVYTRDARDTNVRSFFLLEFSLLWWRARRWAGCPLLSFPAGRVRATDLGLGVPWALFRFFFFPFCAVVSLCQCRRHSSPCRVTRMCKVDPSVVVSYHRERGEGEGFKLKEGFALIVAATGGFLFLSFAVCISNCASRPSPKYRPSQATIP